MDPKLTIGFAHHTDYDGAYFTLQALRLYHAEAMREVELVVVDQSIGTKHSQLLGALINNTIGGRQYHPETQTWRDPPSRPDGFWEHRNIAGCQYVPFTEAIGTSASRDKIFAVARAPAVLILDCHVLIEPGAIARLIEWFDDPQHVDLYSGPLRYDTMGGLAGGGGVDMVTHFNAEWRSQMYGTWGKAWKCGCGPDGVEFSPIMQPLPEDHRRKICAWRLLAEQTPLRGCYACGKELPENLTWEGHDQALQEDGYLVLGTCNTDQPFEIPGCGLGAFACRKDAWPGFNEHARGFGGEELYIHEKFRQLGRKSVCLPFLKWVHRFGRASGVPYPLDLWSKVRNYVLEWDELGRPFDDIHEHFVLNGPMTQADWEHLVADPVEHVKAPQTGGGCAGCPQNKAVDNAKTLDELFDVLCKQPRDLNEHLPRLRRLAEQVDHVTEFAKRRESTVAFLAGRPKVLRSYQQERDRAINRAHAWAAKAGVDVKIENKSSRQAGPTIEETDLLWIDEEHTGARLRQQLDAYAGQVRRFIVLHDTQLHGEKGQDGGPGLLTALRRWMRENPEWSVIEHTPDQYGLTIVGRLDRDKPQLPKASTMAGNLGKALAGYVGGGMQHATADQVEQRLLVCSACPHRRNTRCSACGCFLEAKAKMRGQDCPLGYWPPLPKEDG